MTIGVLTLELGIFDARSLKDKRRTLKSVKDRLRNTFSVSVAEVDELDSWQRAVLGVAMVGNETRFVHSCLDKIVDWIRKQRSITLIDYTTEMR